MVLVMAIRAGGRDLERALVVESGRRDGNDCVMLLVIGYWLLSAAVVVSPGGVGMVEAKEWHGRAGSWVKYDAGCTVAGVVALAAQVQLSRPELGFPGWVFSECKAFGAW
jgi:hypothetical protein